MHTTNLHLFSPVMDESVAVQRFNLLSAKIQREAARDFKFLHAQLTAANSKVTKRLSEEDPPSPSLEQEASHALALASSHHSQNVPPQHLITAQRNMMVVLAGRNREEYAIVLGQRAHADLHRLLGPLHPTTIALLRELSVVVLASGDLQSAEPLLRAAVRGCAELFGEVHPDTLSARMLLGQLLATRGSLDEAKHLFRANLAAARALYGDGAPLAEVAASNLSALLMERREFWEAEGILTWQLRLVRRLHGRSSQQAREVATRLAECKLAGSDDHSCIQHIWPKRASPPEFGKCSACSACEPCAQHASSSHDAIE
jgi:tetratricopeptide (TPR) repeat protein